MSYYPEIAAQNPALMMALNESSSAAAPIDSSSNALACSYITPHGNGGVLIGIPGAKAGGSAVRMRTSFIDCGNPSALQITGPITIFIVFRIDAWLTTATTQDG